MTLRSSKRQDRGRRRSKARRRKPTATRSSKTTRRPWTDKQNQTLKPLVDKTTRRDGRRRRKRKGLVLVVDRTNVIYGGTDITADVTSAS